MPRLRENFVEALYWTVGGFVVGIMLIAFVGILDLLGALDPLIDLFEAHIFKLP